MVRAERCRAPSERKRRQTNARMDDQRRIYNGRMGKCAGEQTKTSCQSDAKIVQFFPSYLSFMIHRNGSKPTLANHRDFYDLNRTGLHFYSDIRSSLDARRLEPEDLVHNSK